MDASTRSCLESALQYKHGSRDFCRELSPASLEAFTKVKRRLSYAAGATVFDEGEAPRGIFVLCEGRIKLSMNASNGRTLILKIAEPGGVLGLDSVIAGKTYELTAEAMQACKLDFVRRTEFLRFLDEHVDACRRAVQQISHECLEMHDRIRLIGLTNSVHGRLAHFLLELSARAQRDGDGFVKLGIGLTHEEISQLIGASREAVTRVLADFNKSGIAELRGGTLIIHNKAELEKLLAA